jgi:uncharacterized repeat protein (TIGR01451 family)
MRRIIRIFILLTLALASFATRTESKGNGVTRSAPLLQSRLVVFETFMRPGDTRCKATGPVIDQLADEYAAAGKLAVFLEQNNDYPMGDRRDRWWAAYTGGGTVYLPLVMVSSGHQISSDDLGGFAYGTYKAMVDAELARPAQAEIIASKQRIGDKLHFDIKLTNLSGTALSSSNMAQVHALVYEEHTPSDPNVDHITHRIVRAAVSTGVALANGATADFALETDDLTNIADWNKVHSIVLADYIPGGTSSAYDMLQAVSVEPRAALTINKQASLDSVPPGAPLTYTIHISNTGDLDLHALVTDTLPAHVVPTGILTWTPPAIAAPGGDWTLSFVVTVEAGYTGPFVNTVQVTTEEGASGVAIAITNAKKVYLPVVTKN